MQMRIVIEGSMQGSEPALLLKMQQGGCIVFAFAFAMQPTCLHCYWKCRQFTDSCRRVCARASAVLTAGPDLSRFAAVGGTIRGCRGCDAITCSQELRASHLIAGADPLTDQVSRVRQLWQDEVEV